MQSGFVFHDPKHVACDSHAKPLALTSLSQTAD